MQFSYLRNTLATISIAVASMTIVSCSDDDSEPVRPTPPDDEVDEVEQAMYVLNEGQMGMNNASIDMLNLLDGSYTRNMYQEANPSAVLELGDTGNDLTVAGNRLYAVISGSHKVEVIDAQTCKRIDQIDISSPRYAVAHDGYLYVSSWIGGDTNQGSVVKVSLTDNSIVGTLGVGIHPEQMALVGNHLYVTSSQDYSTLQFDNRLYVVDLNTFTVKGTIEAGLNQTQVKAADNGMLYVVTAGNYADVASNLYEVNPQTGSAKALGLTATKLEVYGNYGYILSTTYDENWVANTTISRLNLATGKASEMELESFGDIETPYSIAIDPAYGILYVGDARDYTSTGRVYAYDPTTGSLLDSYNAGVCPAHFAFYRKK